jgi:hypothetical protein
MHPFAFIVCTLLLVYSASSLTCYRCTKDNSGKDKGAASCWTPDASTGTETVEDDGTPCGFCYMTTVKHGSNITISRFCMPGKPAGRLGCITDADKTETCKCTTDLCNNKAYKYEPLNGSSRSIAFTPLTLIGLLGSLLMFGSRS